MPPFRGECTLLGADSLHFGLKNGRSSSKHTIHFVQFNPGPQFAGPCLSPLYQEDAGQNAIF